jgi:hypothetical protein
MPTSSPKAIGIERRPFIVAKENTSSATARPDLPMPKGKTQK